MSQSCRANEGLSLDMFRAIQDANPDGFMVFESVRNEANEIIDFRWLYTNPAAEQMVKRSDTELRGKYLLKEMPGNRDEGLFDAYVKVVETGNIWQRDFPYDHKGLSNWFRSKAIRIGNGFAVSFADITQAKQAEFKLQLNEQRLRLALQTAQMDSWDWVAETNEFVLSGFAAQMFDLQLQSSYSLDDILARVHSRDRERVNTAFRMAHLQSYEFDIEYRILSSTHPIWIAMRGTRYYDEFDRLRLTGIVRNVTERRHSEERQQFQIDAGNVFTASLDYHTTISQILNLIVPRIADWCSIHTLNTQGLIELEGALHSDSELIETLKMVRSISHDEPGACDVSQVLKTAQSVFYPYVRQDVDIFVVCNPEAQSLVSQIGCQSLISTPMITHGEVIGVVALAMGHSGRNYNDKDWRMIDTLAHNIAVALENARLYSDMREAVRIREAFLSIAAHELRNPLTALIGQAQLMQRRLQRSPESLEQDIRTLGIIVDQSNRLNKMINSLLDISRLERGEEQFDFYDLEMCSFTRRIMTDFQASSERHQLVYQGEQGPLFISGDMARMEQVLQNLIANAIKYSPTGGDITVAIERVDHMLQLSVTDTGIGIPQAALPNLFKQFYRASNAGGYASGLGIGLYIVREIVVRHNGRISVDSIEGKGSSFRITLPLIKPQPEDESLGFGD